MPIYAYRCETCGFQQDVLQKMSDARLTVCPSCGNATLQKQVTAAGFQLKGSGWYVTDFRNPAAKAGTKPDGQVAESKDANASGGETKSETSAGDKGVDKAPSPPPAPAASSDATPAPAPAPAKASPPSGST